VIGEIWPLIESSNATLPEHGRIGKKMVMMASLKKLSVRASKGTLIRAVTEKLHKQEIERLY